MSEMGITSFYFLCFYALVLFLYYIVPSKKQWIVLFIASIAFFMLSLHPWLLLYPLIAGTFCYIGTNIMIKHPSKKGRGLIIGIVTALGILFLLKYINFFVYTWNVATTSVNGMKLSTVQFLIPLGISFYTFSMIGYVIDVYNDIAKPQKNYCKFMLYGIYFPILISGPLLKYREDGEQFFIPHRFDYKQVTFGMQRMLWGFFKKLIISERLAILVTTIYQQYTVYSGMYIWLATICFALQLYADFSGCMDIVIGLSQTFGIKLPENFEFPFTAKSISEYWRRWHITLGSWMKDYVFYPLLRTKVLMNIGDWSKKRYGKKWGKKIPLYIGMLGLWFTVGLWHGGAWKYIVGSGLLHFVYIVGGELMEPIFNSICIHLRVKRESKYFQIFRQIRTFMLVCFGFVFFRADSFREALAIIQYGMVPSNVQGLFVGGFMNLGLDIYELCILSVCLVLLWIVESIQKKESVRESIASKHIIPRWIIYFALLFCVILWGYYGPEYSATEFIYQGF